MKFDDFEKVPKLHQVHVDNIPICLSKNDDINRSNLYSTIKPTRKSKSELRIENLPFHLFPNATIIPKQVFNVSLSDSSQYNNLKDQIQ